ncbi:hypothetical protein M0D21_20385 [Aquimarina sp. D1M17]|uniref:hypothetical protein n=1 Tax=Aquimarina acroporae TaxID=2937283 RepID=UPI0020C07AB4|nr:hypothetical protein [Aquimarina acroporae]MCK8523947.1 hypothetical protein [Aquimarina acroporae]
MNILKTKKSIIRQSNIDNIIVFIIFFILFFAIAKYINTDIPAHIRSIVRVNNGETAYSPNFLFFFVVNLLSFFSNNYSLMLFVVVVVLSLATVWKFIISKEIIDSLNSGIEHEYKHNIIRILAFALLFCFAIPDFYNFFVLKKMYLGRTPSVVWHNSTTISLFPFAVLLFWKQFQLFQKDVKSLLDKDLLLVTVLVILNILIKPSFIFAFVPTTVFIVLSDFKLKNYKKYSIQLFPIMVGVLFIIIQFISIYYYQIGSFQSQKSGITIGEPFEFLRHFVPTWYLPIAFLLSFAFPIVTSVYFKEIFNYSPFKYALFLTITGIIISAFFVEDGPRRNHGNLVWQNIICTFILMLTTASFLISKSFQKNWLSKKMVILWSVFILHFLSGILYLFKIYFTDSYY